MTRRTTPTAVRCEWKCTDKRNRVYTCSQCGQWTANLREYVKGVCPARDRRKGPSERRGD